MCGSLFTAYKYSIYHFLKMSRIKIELSKTFTQFSPVYHKTITKGCYNIIKIKEGARPHDRPTKGRKDYTMKNLYLVSDNAGTEVVLHDLDDMTATVIYSVETNTPGFTLSQVEDMSAGEVFEDVTDIEKWLGIEYNNGETSRIIETIEDWEG